MGVQVKALSDSERGDIFRKVRRLIDFYGFTPFGAMKACCLWRGYGMRRIGELLSRFEGYVPRMVDGYEVWVYAGET